MMGKTFAKPYLEGHDLGDMFSILLVLYAFDRSIGLSFSDDGELLSPRTFGQDYLMEMIYSQSSLAVPGNRCRKAGEFYDHLCNDGIRRYNFERMVSFLIRHNIQMKDDRHLKAQDKMAQRIAAVLQRRGCRRIYEVNSGVGAFSRAYEGYERFDCHEDRVRFRTVAMVLDEIKGTPSRDRYSPDNRDLSGLRGYDAVIGTFVPTTGSREDIERTVVDLESFIDALTSSREASPDSWRHAVIVTDADFRFNLKYEPLRRKLVSAGLTGIYENGGFLRLTIDADVDDGLVRMAAPITISDSIIKVTREHMKRMGCAFVPYLYLPDTHDARAEVLFPEDAVVSSLGELIEGVCEGDMDFFREKEGYDPATAGDDCTVRDRYDLLCDDVLYPAGFPQPGTDPVVPVRFRKLMNHHPSLAPFRMYHGRGIALLFPWRHGPMMSVGIVDDDRDFLTIRNCVFLRVREGVSPRYVLHVLRQSSCVDYLLRAIADEGLDDWRFSYSAYAGLLEGCEVPLVRGFERQEELADAMSEVIRSSSRDGKAFNLITVGHPFTGEEKSQLEAFNLHVRLELGSEGEKTGKELAGVLSSDAGKAVRSYHAVVINPEADCDMASWPHHMTMAFVAGQVVPAFADRIPFVVYSQKDISSLEELRMFLGHFETPGHYCLASGDGIRRLATGLRSILDLAHSVDASVMGKYAVELQAASSIDPGGELAEIIVETMREDFGPEVLRDTDRKFNSLRACVEKILLDGQRRGLFPPLRPGAFCSLLEDGVYVDSASRNGIRCYRMTGSPMHEVLMESVRFLIDITNGGSHETDDGRLDVRGYVRESRSPNLYKACTYVLMDLVRWYSSLCAGDVPAVFEEVAPFGPDDTVQCLPDDPDYRFIGHVHLQGAPRIGGKVRLNRMTSEKNPRGDVFLYSKDYRML